MGLQVVMLRCNSSLCMSAETNGSHPLRLVDAVVGGGEGAAVVDEVDHDADSRTVDRLQVGLDEGDLGPEREDRHRDGAEGEENRECPPGPALAHLREEMQSIYPTN